MSTMLKEKYALAKLRAELEGQKGKICWCCKKFGHLAQNCKNQVSQNLFSHISINSLMVLMVLMALESP